MLFIYLGWRKYFQDKVKLELYDDPYIFGKLNIPDYFLLWLLMKFKTLNIQDDKILGANACSLWKNILFFYMKMYMYVYFHFYLQKYVPLKKKFRHGSQIKKVVKNFDGAGKYIFDHVSCFITYSLKFSMEIEWYEKKSPFFQL